MASTRIEIGSRTADVKELELEPTTQRLSVRILLIPPQKEKGTRLGVSQVAGPGFAGPGESQGTRDLRVMSSNPISVPSDRQTVHAS